MLAITGTQIESIHVPIDEIEISPGQPRKDFDEPKLKRLAQSMAEHDLLQPIGVRASTGSSNWELCFGERRLRAARLLGWRTIEARVLDVNDIAALKVMGIENINRDDWNVIEKAAYLETLSNAGMTNKQIAQTFGREESWSKRTRRLLKLPKYLQGKLISGEMSPASACYILRFTGKPQVFAAIDEDIRSNPDHWRTLDGCQARANEIAACFDNLESAPPAGTEAAGDRQPAPKAPARDWTKFKPYLPIIEPLRKDREALLLLRELVDVLLAELKRPDTNDAGLLEPSA